MNAYTIVEQFEKKVAEFAGAPYAVAVDCCTSALFLSLKYLEASGPIRLPANTYISVPFAIMNAGGIPVFEDCHWTGVYPLLPYSIWDGAKRFRKNMYLGGFHCLSFHAKKHIPIGRGGMILCDSLKAVQWLRKARYDGREGKHYPNERIEMLGWHCYMTPEQAARGLALMDVMQPDLPDLVEDYPDLRLMPVFQKAQRAAA